MRCTAKSSRTGEPCKKWAIQGGNVCDTHGGRAPQVKQAAMERIKDAAAEVAAELVRLAVYAESESVRVAAGKDILDRAGFGAKQKIESEVTVHEVDDFARAVAELEAEFDGRRQSRGAVAEDPAAPPDRS